MTPRRPTLPHAVRSLLDYMSVKPGETVLITADTGTDMKVADALFLGALDLDAQPAIVRMPQLPFQGQLADPHIPAPARAAMLAADCWIDLTFPYLAGSHAHDEAMKQGKTRYLLGGDLHEKAFCRLFGALDFDRYYQAQAVFDQVLRAAIGKTCRITSRTGTDVSFRLDKAPFAKPRRVTQPGMYVVPGTWTIAPDIESVAGTIVVERGFHEAYGVFGSPVTLYIDRQVIDVAGDAAALAPLRRAMLRAGNGKGYGGVIHFSHGMHPAAMLTGTCFIEDSRTLGSNAIGLGIPWWLPGGGENHPDVVLTGHSVWIDGVPIIQDGLIVGPPELVDAVGPLAPTYPPNITDSVTLARPPHIPG
ncbi:MAG: hypothetical protein QHC78_11885 [Pigmentiphaga sp.]|uniref:hypothetical protein n=1 Tax=Pigmentiphaga sp. TaxID=1977564 RepID=UPI0029A91CE3|nr:hypothetical protein [Pigmentiphaga sp.]MDX3906378.1 hypothetical protein [Pigmentiphaga sp.]